MKKTCSKCGFEKPLSEFHKDKTQSTGFCPSCKDCVSKKRKKHYRKNRTLEIKYNSSWSRKNRKRINSVKKGYAFTLTDSYIRTVLIKRTLLKASDIPKELVDLKREQLKIHRFLKGLK